MNPYLKLAIALVIYVAVGHKILRKAFRNIKNGQIFDENFLMVVATFGALAMGEYTVMFVSLPKVTKRT